MAAIFVGGAMGMIKLVCPHCQELQVRGHKPKHSVYACRKCRKRFTREEGEAGARGR
jgi:transposase-like protein